jgi:segregation and condensation protein A
LDHLLTLARAREIDLSRLPLSVLIDQLAAALREAPPATPLGEKGDWVVMAAWLVQLRSLLLLPPDAPARQDAAAAAEELRGHLVDLQAMRTLAAWLERRPLLGHDVFPRGRPELFGISVDGGQAIDVVAFLWASLELFDDGSAAPDTAIIYRPVHLELFNVADARERILRRLADAPGGASLDQLLPNDIEPESRPAIRRRSAWSSTFVASLELARQGDVALHQEGFPDPIHVSSIARTAGT